MSDPHERAGAKPVERTAAAPADPRGARVNGINPSTREHRGAVRWVPGVRGAARVHLNGRTWQADIEDLSAQGARLRLEPDVDATPLARHAEVELDMDLGPRTYRRRARVAWSAGHADGRPRIALEHLPDNAAEESPAALDVRLVRIDPALALRVPAALALRRRVLPMCQVDGHVQVACADLRDGAALVALERYFDLPLRAQQADPESLTQVLRRIYTDARSTRETDADDPVALCNDLLYAAWLRGASDIHVDHERDGVRVRLRVDGQLEDYRRLQGGSQATELLSRIKVMGGMDIAEKRAPQDGRFTHQISPGVAFDIRVATLPTKHGERATLRFLAIDMEALTLENLGMSARDLLECERAIRRPHGLILATGPTGCGKTTTLYAALRRILGQREVNAISVQDPVEYDIPGVAQVEVDTAQKVTFAKALRSILRHDPDVIMIGEIRDQETADIAIKAALTGHLVLATLHTNSAASAVTRLADMGADRYLIAATLRLVIAQRLVRRACKYCSTLTHMAPEAARALHRPSAAGMALFEPEGCVYCAGRGHGGRAGLFELLPLDEALALSISEGASEAQIAAASRAQSIPTIQDDAIEKLASGITSLREVLAAVAS